jgi:hypothetical protein
MNQALSPIQRREAQMAALAVDTQEARDQLVVDLVLELLSLGEIAEARRWAGLIDDQGLRETYLADVEAASLMALDDGANA